MSIEMNNGAGLIVSNSTKLQNKFSWVPEVTFETGIFLKINWFMDFSNCLEFFSSREKL